MPPKICYDCEKRDKQIKKLKKEIKRLKGMNND